MKKKSIRIAETIEIVDLHVDGIDSPLVALQVVPGEELDVAHSEGPEDAELVIVSAEQVLVLRSQIERVAKTFKRIRSAQ